jgi:hypothetical protein
LVGTGPARFEAVRSVSISFEPDGRANLGLPAKTDDPEVAELRRRLVSLPTESQARVLEGVLTRGFAYVSSPSKSATRSARVQGKLAPLPAIGRVVETRSRVAGEDK